MGECALPKRAFVAAIVAGRAIVTGRRPRPGEDALFRSGKGRPLNNRTLGMVGDC